MAFIPLFEKSFLYHGGRITRGGGRWWRMFFNTFVFNTTPAVYMLLHNFGFFIFLFSFYAVVRNPCWVLH